MTEDADEAVAWAARVRATYAEVSAPLWRAVLGWSAAVDVADEAVAEAFAQLLRRGAEVRDPAAWVWRAAFRVAAGDLQERRRTGDRQLGGAAGERALDRLAGRGSPPPDELFDLLAPLGRLSDQQRGCVVLVDLFGHTAPSAARILGTTPATVRVQLSRAHRRLREELTDSTGPTRPEREERR